jgi:adenine-specific DNA-methyltransferase
MATRIRYMGNKHYVAPHISAIVAEEPDGRALVDAFSGMCSVAGAFAEGRRRVICNDVQSFASLVAGCLITSPRSCPSPERLSDALSGPYRYNFARLRDRFSEELALEGSILAAADPGRYRSAYMDWPHAANDTHAARELAACGAQTGAARYGLVSLSFAWGYFGLRQAASIDSIRYAIDRARDTGALDDGECDWALMALLQAASCASASPGHFAQYLRPGTESGFRRILSQRRRDIWGQFLHEASLLRPYGTRLWRKGNAALQGDALTLGERLDELGVESAVIYADPPYSKDHYSRYYHVLETLVLYDHPKAEGAGRYRPDRFATPFSIKSKVEDAMEEFCEMVGERGFTLILSYPSNGLLNGVCGIDPTEILARHFERVRIRRRLPTSHSTLGARHGSASNVVEELLWVADSPRY